MLALELNSCHPQAYHGALPAQLAVVAKHTAADDVGCRARCKVPNAGHSYQVGYKAACSNSLMDGKAAR